jgi:hypothetical protein
LATAHVWLANLGLAGLVGGFLVAPHIGAASVLLTASGGTLWAVGAYGFVYNMWRTFAAAERRRQLNQRQPDTRHLPTR